MSSCGLTCSSVCRRPSSSLWLCRDASGGRGKRLVFFPFGRKTLEGSVFRHPYRHVGRNLSQHTLKVSMDASLGNTADDSNLIFPGINIRDPYRRLGISKEASEEEIQAARNYLINKYAGHKPSVDAIESAHDKIIMQKFYERKNPKINIKKKVREVTQTPVMKFILNRFETPSRIHLIKTIVAYLILGVLTFLFPTEEGPTLQVLISFFATIYFINDRLRSRWRAFLYGAGAFIISWLVGTLLMVSVIPRLLEGPRSLEVSTSLVSYVMLWVSSSYLK